MSGDERPAPSAPTCPRCGAPAEYDEKNGLFWHAQLVRVRVHSGVRNTGRLRECPVTNWLRQEGA